MSALQDDSTQRHVSSWHIRVDLFDSGDDTTAHAVVVDEGTGDTPVSRAALGAAKRLPGTVNVHEIGREVAVGRALRALAEQLLGEAAEDIAAVRHEPAQPLH
jgi:hypothetical protein